LNENGLSIELIKKILEKGSANIQNFVLEHDEITRETILKFAENGITTKVKNKANQKLRSKRFKK
jgi:hypothetical protein